MEFKLYKFEFIAGVHFGKGTLERGEMIFRADTLFSALCQEALKMDCLDKLVKMAYADRLLLSDAFPYKGRQFYIPKPCIYIEPKDRKGNSLEKKKFKRMQYIPADDMELYLSGCYTPQPDDFGNFVMKVSAALRGRDEAEPYRIQCFEFNDSCGLYVLVGCADNEVLEFVMQLLESLAYSGLGGKRHAGLGRFEGGWQKVPEYLRERLDDDSECQMLLSSALPEEDKLDEILTDASYKLLRRSGFVESVNYADQYMRKRDLYVFASGSCFKRRFSGTIPNVGVGGSHPVYRYAKALFLGMDVKI